MSVSNYFDKFQYHRQVIPMLSKKIYCMGERISIYYNNRLHHYGNIIMIPVYFRVYVDIKRTQQNKVG
jgi:hypothetical protein